MTVRFENCRFRCWEFVTWLKFAEMHSFFKTPYYKLLLTTCILPAYFVINWEIKRLLEVSMHVPELHLYWWYSYNVLLCLELEFEHWKEHIDSKSNLVLNLFDPAVNLCCPVWIVTFFLALFLLSPTREFFVEHCRDMHTGYVFYIN